MASLRKNVASQFFTFVTIGSTTGLLSTSTSTTIFNSVSFVSTGSTQVALAGTFASLGNGQWSYTPTQGETNYNSVGFLFEPASTVPVNIHFFTDTFDANGLPGVNVVDFGGTAVTGRDIGASVLVSSGTGTGQIVLTSGQVTVGTNNDKTGYTASTVSDKTGYSLSATAQSSVADVILDRDMSLGVDNGSTSVRTPRQAFRFLRNKFAISAGTLTVYKEDDATTSWTGTVTASSAASPVIGNDPAGP